MNPNPLQPAGSPTLPPAPVPLWQAVREFPGPVWCILIGMFINRFGTFVVPFLTLHLTRLGYTASQSGVALGAYGVGHLIASVLGGHLADSVGCRRTVVASMGCGAVCLLLMSQAREYGALLLLAFLTGLTGELYRPASSALLANLVPEARRITVFGAYRFAINAGFAFGPAVAGLLAQHSYDWLFFGNAATSLVYGLLAWRWLPRDHSTASSPRAWVAGACSSLAAGFRAAAADPAFVRLLVASFGVSLVFLQMVSSLGLAIHAAGLPDRVYGLVLGCNGALVVLFELPMTTVTQRRPPRRMIGAGFVLAGLGAALFGCATTPLTFTLAMGVLTFGEILSMPVAMAYVSGLAPTGMRGRYLGLYGLTWAAGLAVGPALGTTLFAYRPAVLWTACAVLGLLAGGLVLARGASESVVSAPGGRTVRT